MILESDGSWKTQTENRIKMLEAELTRVTSHLALPSIAGSSAQDVEEGQQTETSISAYMTPQTEKNVPDNFEMVLDPTSGPAAIPGSVVSRIAIPSEGTIGEMEQDIIARGVITEQQAQTFLDVYQNRLDHFLYRIIGDRQTLQEIRSSSSLLLAAICAVSALHLVAPEYEKCYQEFVSLAAAHTFSRRRTVGDVRALCVAAFWLSGISWTCVGAAVQIATEIGLHRSIFAALEGDRLHYQRTRLYYLVYVCDHHFSVVYGRPPMTREDDAIKASMTFLDCAHAVEDDARLVSQIERWKIGSEIHETFGVDVDRPLRHAQIGPLRRLGIKLDAVRADWEERFACNPYVGNYPKKGVGLHYHFAKLYLTSMALRGIGKANFKPPNIALDIEEITNMAVLSATSILKVVIHDTEIQGHLNGLPTYFDVMIAFAAVFIMKISSKYSASVKVDISELRALVADLVTTLERVTSSMHPRHLLVSVARGTRALLSECYGGTPNAPYLDNTRNALPQPGFDDVLHGYSGDWNTGASELFSMGDFDFLSTQIIADFQPQTQLF